MKFDQYNIHSWLESYKIVNEKGERIEFTNHPFLWDIYSDFSPLMVGLKPAQVGWSTLAILKKFWLAGNRKMDMIYTLPTEADVSTFVGGKTNRIIANNPILLQYVKDKDTIEQKQVGDSMIYYRGTWTKKAAIMVTSDLNIHDEIDSSKQDVVSDYEARLQHSKYGWRWYFSHPSAPGAGVDKYWQLSDQKHWFIQCEHCNKWHFMDFPDSIDMEKRIFVCKLCKKPISDLTRSLGKWVNKYKRDSLRPFSGYWISSMICPWLSAGYIIDKFNDPNSDEEFFYNKVLGLPYAGSGNVVNEESLWRNLTDKINLHKDRIIIGVDTGIPNYFVVGNQESIFYYGYDKGYTEIERMLRRWKNAIAVFDAQGDLFYPRKLREKYVGRVFLCHYRQDQKTMSLIKWGKKKEEGSVVVDRNRMIQLVVDEFTDGRIPLQGVKNDWYDYWLHWKNIYRIREKNQLGIIQSKWERSGADHLVHATVYWRVGMNRFGTGSARMFEPNQPKIPSAPTIQPDDTIENQLSKKLIFPEREEDWRDV